MNKPATRKRLFESVVEQLYDLILTGELKPGDCLPSERELCEMFQVSRTSIRSAIQALETLGLVECSNGRTARIKKANQDEVGGVLSMVLFHDLADVRQLYECRRFLESWVACYAATRLTEEQIDHLDRLSQERKRLIEAGGNGYDEDFAFHWHLAKYSGNEVSGRLVFALLNALFKLLGPRGDDLPWGVSKHEEIVASLRRHDPPAAMKAMWQHLTETSASSPFPLDGGGPSAGSVSSDFEGRNNCSSE